MCCVRVGLQYNAVQRHNFLLVLDAEARPLASRGQLVPVSLECLRHDFLANQRHRYAESHDSNATLSASWSCLDGVNLKRYQPC
jgi:hypothetical protein